MLKNETKITLSQAAKLCPGRPHACSLWRWARQGIKARNGEHVRLEHIRCGGKIFTSPEALERMFAAIAERDVQHFHVCATSYDTTSTR